MKLQRIDHNFTVCKIDSFEHIDLTGEFVFLSKTDDEISLVCESNKVPPHVIAAESGWKALKICGILEFSMVGVISRISSILAEAGIGIFVISTYNTDYILLKSENFDRSITALMDNEYVIV